MYALHHLRQSENDWINKMNENKNSFFSDVVDDAMLHVAADGFIHLQYRYTFSGVHSLSIELILAFNRPLLYQLSPWTGTLAEHSGIYGVFDK